MASLGEIERAWEVLRANGSGPIALLHCVAMYPPRPEDINLRNMATLQAAFDAPIGFSDHSIGTSIPLAAIALGASIVEKHFTLDKSLDGWDHAISADPVELQAIVLGGRDIQAALGSSVRRISRAEMEKRRSFRRRLVVRRSMRKGDVLRLDDLDFKRPGTGVNPDQIAYIVGRRLTKDLEEDGEIEWADVA
jgi:N-acetylneuraminate synthase